MRDAPRSSPWARMRPAVSLAMVVVLSGPPLSAACIALCLSDGGSRIAVTAATEIAHEDHSRTQAPSQVSGDQRAVTSPRHHHGVTPGDDGPVAGRVNGSAVDERCCSDPGASVVAATTRSHSDILSGTAPAEPMAVVDDWSTRGTGVGSRPPRFSLTASRLVLRI